MMQIFTRVVEAQSFAGAAKGLSLPRSTVSRAIQDLESRLNVRLLQRTTRTLQVTPNGSLYYDHCQLILSEIDNVEFELAETAQHVRGTLRVDMTASFARTIVLPAMRDFQARHPALSLVLTLGDRTIDLLEEGVDCVVRAGIPAPSALLVARPVGSFKWISCASPGYLARHGTPLVLAALAEHSIIEFHSGRTGRATDWHMIVDGKEYAVPARGSLAVNDTDAYVNCALEGLGLIRIADYLAEPHIASGRLVAVLPQLASPVVPLSVIYPQNRHLPSTVRTFVDWIASRLRTLETARSAPLAPP
ncbi:LysR family transcriptional regulator [Massilia sp. S19_KUP03_FR1]|uniref:LysR family transcriptional regulator n=1 Tax=Massilia sp. S19_KUP03_FR1 TaxID=3025503 RepID=UPI002FCDA54A